MNNKSSRLIVLSLAGAVFLAAAVAVLPVLSAEDPVPTPSVPIGEERVGTVTFSDLNLENYPTIAAYLSVTDPAGQPINLVSIRELAVTEEGKDVSGLTIIDADPVTDPLSVVIAVDISGSMAGAPLDAAKRAAESFIGLLKPGDKAALVTFDQDVYVNLGLTDDKDALTKAVRELKYKGDTALYQAVIDSAKILEAAPAGRRIVVILTDGKNDKANSPATDADAIAGAGKASSVVITVGLGPDANRTILQKIADETGGRAFFAPGPSDLESIYRLISDQIHHQYRVSFISPFPTRPDGVVLFHTLGVSLVYGGEKITGKKEFLASTNPPVDTMVLYDFHKKEKTENFFTIAFGALSIVAIALIVAIAVILVVRKARERR
jgi:VWFA-related protein